MALGEVQVVLHQRVLRAVAAADHALTAPDASGPVRSVAAEERIGYGLALLAEEHADAGLGVRFAEPVLLGILLQQQISGRVLAVGGDSEHPLGLVVVRRELALPVDEPRYLGVGVERRSRAV